MIQTRSAARRAGLSALSSDSTASSGRSRGEPLEQQFVGLVVAGLAQVVTGQLRHAEREEQVSSLGGQACRKGDVGGERTHSEVTVALATWPAAAEHGAVLLRTGRSA